MESIFHISLRAKEKQIERVIMIKKMLLKYELQAQEYDGVLP